MTTGDEKARVLVVGDANPDLVLRGDIVPRFGQAEQLLTDAALVLAGSAGITAHGLARLGRPANLLAAVGVDEHGRFVQAELAAAGVDCSLVRVVDDCPTGLSVVLAAPHDRAILTLPGTIPALTPADVADAFDTVFGPSDAPTTGHLHVSSLFLQPALIPALGELFAGARARGVTTSLDTNADPSGRWTGVREVLAHADVFLPNAAEAIAISGVPDARQAAQELADDAGCVVVTDGAAGAFVATAEGVVADEPAADCEPVDGTGAGDTFAAAYLDAWLSGDPPQVCLRRAVAAGALAVSAIGGTAGQPTRARLDALTGVRAAESAPVT